MTDQGTLFTRVNPRINRIALDPGLKVAITYCHLGSDNGNPLISISESHAINVSFFISTHFLLHTSMDKSYTNISCSRIDVGGYDYMLDNQIYRSAEIKERLEDKTI